MVTSLVYPPPLDPARDAADMPLRDGTPPDIETPILIAGGGPVGMILALILARIHKQPCVLIEREVTTTPFPKMEYTNGRSMEVYRAMGLHEDLRKVATAEVAEHYSNDELVVTSVVDGGKHIHTWEHDGAAAQRVKSQKINDGSQYLEPHMRCHQIIIEKWLKEKVQAEPLISSHWGTAFAGLTETSDAVITHVVKATGEHLWIKSKYVIGTDGGGSWVRKSAGLESKRTYLDLTSAFVHFRSSALRKAIPFPRAWHYNVVAGGVLVTQNEADMWTCHLILPPDVDAASLTEDQIISTAIGGCQGPVPVAYDEIYCRGLWKVDVAIANNFRSSSGRVLIAGDAAHQLSPLGGHGLNSGIGDVYDLAWKLSAVLQGWGADALLSSYTDERRQVAFENLDHVQEALTTIVVPLFASHLKYGADVLNDDSSEGVEAREKLIEVSRQGHWLHDQNGNILGVTYKDSQIIVESQETGKRPKGTNELYIPTTYPGSRAPHVYLTDGTSTLDAFSPTHFNLVDFSDGALGAAFVQAANTMDLPLQVVSWDRSSEMHVRDIYESDLVLLRPDGYVAWRAPAKSTRPLTGEEATDILRVVSGHTYKHVSS